MIISQNSNDVYYAYTRGRFWRWDESAQAWKESHLMAQKFDKARAVEKRLAPEVFLTSDEFTPMDDYELPNQMLTALMDAKPCKNAPIDPVEEESICTTAPTADAAVTTKESAAQSFTAATPTTSASEAAANGLTPALSPQSSASAPVVPAETSFASAAVPTFDFSPLGELSGQAIEADRQFDQHYSTAQDEYLISCIYLARIHALTAKAGRYGGGTWTKWYESKGLSKSSSWNMVKTGESFNGSTIEQLKQLPELTRKDLNLIARSGCADQLVANAGDSQKVQALLEQLHAAEARADAAIADVNGLTEQNAKLQQSYHDADESRIAANLQRQKAEAERDRAKERAKNAEEALKHQPIVGVIDEEEVDRRAAEKARGLADARNAELAKDNASLKKQLAALRAKASDDAQADFETANFCVNSIRAAWDTSRASYARLVGEDLERTFQSLCGVLNSIMEEAARLCRQPPDYDGGDGDE